MVNILVSEPDSFSKKCIEALKEIGNVESLKLSREELLEKIENIDVLVVRLDTNVDRELISRGKNLKIIGTPTTGLDHIDVSYARERGIKIISLEEEFEFLDKINASTEHTIALILSLIRKIPWAFDSIRKGVWDRKSYYGTELNGKTLGIIGYGRIGKKAAKIATAFGAKIIAHDPYVKNADVELVSFERILRNSDIVLLSVKLTPETENMIGKEQLEMMKNSAILINVSRGKIVDEEDLLEALKNGKIAGAAIDVIRDEVVKENPLENNPLVNYAREHDNLLITPHIAGSTFESMEATGLFIINKIKEALNV